MLSYKNNDVDRHQINTFQYSWFSINFPSLDNSSSQLTYPKNFLFCNH